MKRFKKLLPIAGILVLVSALVVPTAVLAAPLTAISVFQSNEAPNAIDDIFIEFTTATALSACVMPGLNYSQFNLNFAGPIPLPPENGTGYTLELDGVPAVYEALGVAPIGENGYSVTIVGTDVNIKYFHLGEVAPGTVIEILVMSNNPPSTGYLPIDIATRDQADDLTDVDTGRGYYLVRQPQELVATALAGEVSVTIGPGHVYYGVVATGDVQNTALFDDPDNLLGMAPAYTQTIMNTGGVNLNYDIKTSDALEAGLGEDDWALVEFTGNLDEFTHAYNIDASEYVGGAPIGAFTKWTAPDAYVLGVATDVAPGSPRYLELEIGIPTSVTSYEAHQITVTVQVSAS